MRHSGRAPRGGMTADECKHSAAACGGSGLKLTLGCGVGEDGNAERSRYASIPPNIIGPARLNFWVLRYDSGLIDIKARIRQE